MRATQTSGLVSGLESGVWLPDQTVLRRAGSFSHFEMVRRKRQNRPDMRQKVLVGFIFRMTVKGGGSITHLLIDMKHCPVFIGLVLCGDVI